MRQHVQNHEPPLPGAELFKGRRGWLRRFTKTWNITLRRKPNVKKVPIAQRIPFLKRWFAVFAMFLQSKKETVGYDDKFGLYKLRASLDQVPAGKADSFDASDRPCSGRNLRPEKYI